MFNFSELRGTPIRLPLIIKLLLLFNIIFSISAYSQDLKIHYLYNSLVENNDKEEMLMTLRIGKEKSYYYNEDTFQADSIMSAFNEPSIEMIPNLKSSVFCLIKKNRTSKNILFFENIWRTIYEVNENVNIAWKVLPDADIFLDYKVQKATGKYGGRNWEVWFAPDIPISDGPYKFFGLPGLILKVQDDKSQHTFTAISIRKMDMILSYPYVDRYNFGGSISNDLFKKIKRKFIENPETQLESIFDKPGSNKNAIRKEEVEAIKKRNSRINPIEL